MTRDYLAVGKEEVGRRLREDTLNGFVEKFYEKVLGNPDNFEGYLLQLENKNLADRVPLTWTKHKKRTTREFEMEETPLFGHPIVPDNSS